jgi:hypothetical protein
MSDNQKDKPSPTDKESKGRFAVTMAASSSFGASVYHIPAADTPEGKERIRAYYEALGQFAAMYAETEAVMQRVLWHYAKTPSAISRSVFSGTRIRQGCTFIRRICEATSVSDAIQKELDYLFKQLNDITNARDWILHYGARSVAEGRGIVTNAPIAHTVARVTTFPISTDILGDMTADLHKIILYLMARHGGRMVPRGLVGWQPVETIVQGEPWRYTPSQLPLPEDHKQEGPDDPNHTTPHNPLTSSRG